VLGASNRRQQLALSIWQLAKAKKGRVPNECPVLIFTIFLQMIPAGYAISI